jgi:uncharacterized iron-regulated membrane protein
MEFSLKTFHKYLGMVMLLPFIAWAITGIFFFFKPGYSEAYQSLSVKQYPLQYLINLPSTVNGKPSKWLEVRQLTTILGDHLLVKAKDGWQQLSPESFEIIDEPNNAQITALVNDAIREKSERYGKIESINKLIITTNTDVRITLNWQNMSLRQQGADTDLINTIYNIHYLRWTGIKAIDQVLGVVGLLLVVLLASIGTVMTIKNRQPR